MKHALPAILAALLLAGCTSTVSKNVRADGSVGELVWPPQEKSWRKEPLRLPPPSIAAVQVGLERQNVFALLDVPHFSEIRGAREWDYLLQRPGYTPENRAVCHLKLIYGDDNRVAAIYWLPEDCATAYGAAQSEPLRLSADALFAFDTATLQAGATATLQDVLHKLSTAGKNARITITGHSDRLGSAAYNRELSRRRAEAVRDYLVRGGIAAGRIRTAGLGSAHPLSACRDDLPRAELIPCLQPDRRVEIGVGAGE